MNLLEWFMCCSEAWHSKMQSTEPPATLVFEITTDRPKSNFVAFGGRQNATASCFGYDIDWQHAQRKQSNDHTVSTVKWAGAFDHHTARLSAFTSRGQRSTSRNPKGSWTHLLYKWYQQLLLPNDVYSVTSAGEWLSHSEGFNFRFKTVATIKIVGLMNPFF